MATYLYSQSLQPPPYIHKTHACWQLIMIPLGSAGVFQVSTIEVNLILFARLSTGPGAKGIDQEIPLGSTM